MSNLFLAKFTVVLILLGWFLVEQNSPGGKQSLNLNFGGNQELPIKLPDGPSLTDSDKEMAGKLQGLAQSSTWSEWLGPLAPIAISPFFGITCLCAIAQFGGDYLPATQFLSQNSVLQNRAVFWIFLVLTLVTSLPRFTKVSKPIAQALDQLEAYSAIIILLVIRFVPNLLSEGGEAAVAMTGASHSIANGEGLFIQMGIMTFSMEILLAIASVINIVVINSIKFFFEILVWLIPVPLVDGALEITNKSICASLMALYAYSPFLATMLNLLLFAICLICFQWVHRRIRFMRTMISDPLWSMVSRSFGTIGKKSLIVFPSDRFQGFPAKSRLHLKATSEGWEFHGSSWLIFPRVVTLLKKKNSLNFSEGMLINSISVIDCDGNHQKLFFSKRYRGQAEALCREFGLKRDESFESTPKSMAADLAT